MFISEFFSILSDYAQKHLKRKQPAPGRVKLAVVGDTRVGKTSIFAALHYIIYLSHADSIHPRCRKLILLESQQVYTVTRRSYFIK
jgi:hypothetical protein